MIKAAGVYYHKDALRKVIARHGNLVTATLKVQTSGQYAGALRIRVAGQELGSIPHSLAEKYRGALEQLGGLDGGATAHALLEAFPEIDGGQVDVWLWASPAPRVEGEPFLPGLAGGEQVELFDGQSERLVESLHSRAKRKIAVKVAELTPVTERWQVSIDDEAVGVLPLGRHTRLSQAQRQALPLTCRARIVRDPSKRTPFFVDVALPPDP